ncbi:MAG: hypothetical protein ACM33U_08990 [Solirubrobacterales bacterium]|nr:hypothetical protein [Solirubrobacterales bacterium]
MTPDPAVAAVALALAILWLAVLIVAVVESLRHPIDAPDEDYREARRA